MKIWISKNSEVPVRDQLIAQITLGIASGDYEVGQKLPSTREIARRCGLHSNTVGSAYQKLADLNVIEFRKGSGFYVAETAGERIEGARRLDDLISNLLEAAASLGFDEDAIIERLKRKGKAETANRLLVVESDSGLREILVHELGKRFPRTEGTESEQLPSLRLPKDVLLTAMLDEQPKIDGVLADGQRCIYLKGRSVSTAMSGESLPTENEIVGVVSGWDGFLTFARIMLLAAKLDPGRLIVRSTSDEDWKGAIKSASIVICDSLTAESLSARNGVRSFDVIADESLDELSEALPALSMS